MKELILPKNCIKFPTDPSYVEQYYVKQGKYNYNTCKFLFMWSTLADKYANDKVYQKNFWKSLKCVINKELKILSFPSDFEKDLKIMKSIKEKYAEDKKLYNKEHKEEIAKEKETDKEENGFALVDGEKVEIGNRLIESSRIFIGRGENSYRGCIIDDVKGSDVIINTSDKNYICMDTKGVKCNIDFKSDNMSVATYNEHAIGFDVTINKAIWFSSKSEMKADNDEHKFEKCRLLELHINKVNKAIKDMCLSDNLKDKQIGCCAYLISKFGIRAGNEDTRDNGVVGASTLKIENVDILADKQSIHLHFLGKDSIKYSETLKVDVWVLKPFWDLMVIEGSLVRNCKERLFTKITSNDVNGFLQSICLKIKIDELLESKDEDDIKLAIGLIVKYDLKSEYKVNTKKGYVKDDSILEQVKDDCVFATCKVFRSYFGTSLLVKEIQNTNWENLTDKQFKAKYDGCVLTVAKKLNHQKTVTKEQSEKIDKTSKEKITNAKKQYKEKEKSTEEKILKIKNDIVKYTSKGNKAKVKELKQKEKELKEKLAIAKQKMEETKESMKFKLDNKTIALNTSKLNYSSPKVAFSLCKTYNKDPQLIYGKSAKERFEVWCSDVDKDYWKKYPKVD